MFPAVSEKGFPRGKKGHTLAHVEYVFKAADPIEGQPEVAVQVDKVRLQ